MAVTRQELPACYARGEWTALVTAQGTALLHPDFEAQQVQAVWERLLDGGGLSGCLEVLAVDGFAALPAFALVQHDGAQLRVLVRGEVTVAAESQQVDATGIATWRETVLPGSTYTISTAAAPQEAPWPLAAGIVPAARLQWHGSPVFADDQQWEHVGVSPQAGSLQPAETEAHDDAAAHDEGGVHDEAATHDGAAPSPEGTAASPPDPDAEADAEPEAEPEARPEPEPQPGSEPQPEPEPEAQSESQPVPESASVEEATWRRAPSLQSSGSQIIDSMPWDVSASARTQAADGPDSAAVPPPAAPQPEPADLDPEVTIHSEPTVHPDQWQGTAPTDAVPPTDAAPPAEAAPPTEAAAPTDSAPPAEAGPDTAAAPPAQTGSEPEPAYSQEEFPEETVLSPNALRSGAEPTASTEPTASGASAASATSATWGATQQDNTDEPEGVGDLDIGGDHDGETIMVSELQRPGMPAMSGAGDLYDEPAQPQVPGLVISTGVQVSLDRPVLIGRAPESARFDAGVQPRMVTVPSPQQDISRTHVEIRAEGPGAVVTDLNSTNGTILRQPGASPRRLHGGESASVAPGTTIDLGDGVTASLTENAQGQG